jgi:hypothetical protein
MPIQTVSNCTVSLNIVQMHSNNLSLRKEMKWQFWPLTLSLHSERQTATQAPWFCTDRKNSSLYTPSVSKCTNLHLQCCYSRGTTVVPH